MKAGFVYTAQTLPDGRPSQWTARIVDLERDWRSSLVALGADLNTVALVVPAGVQLPRTLKRLASKLTPEETAAERGVLSALPDAELHDLDLDRVVDEDGDSAELSRAVSAIHTLVPELGELRPAWSAKPGRGVHVRLGPLAVPVVGVTAALGRLIEQRAEKAGWVARKNERGTVDGRFRRVPGTGWELDVTKLEAGGRGGLMRLPGGRHKDGVTRKQVVAPPLTVIDGEALVRLAPKPAETKAGRRRVRTSPSVALTSPRTAGAQTKLRALVEQGDRHRARMALADALLSAGVKERDGVPFVEAALGDAIDASSAWHSTRTRRAQGQSRVGSGWLLDALPPDALIELGTVFSTHAGVGEAESLERLFGAPMRTAARLGRVEGALAKGARSAARCRLYQGDKRCGVSSCGALKTSYRTRCDQRACVSCALVKSRQAAEVAEEWKGRAWVGWCFVSTLDEAKRVVSGSDARTFEPTENGWKATVYVREHDAPERISVYRGRLPRLHKFFEVRDVPGPKARDLALSAVVRTATWLDAALRSRPELALSRWEESRSRALHRTCTPGAGYPLPTESMTREAAKEAAAEPDECDCLEACEHDGHGIKPTYDFHVLDRAGRKVATLVTGATLPVKHEALCDLHDEGAEGYGLPEPPEDEARPRRMLAAPPS